MYENYRLLVLFLLASLLTGLGYYLFRSPVLVTKKATIINGKGEKTRIKVTLEVKNRGKDSMRKVKLLDKIPSMANYVKKNEPGTLNPKKVVSSSSKGTSISWEIDQLEPYEERIITYTMKCKLQIVGGMKLPPSKAKFQTAEGKERTSYSNSVNVVEQEEA